MKKLITKGIAFVLAMVLLLSLSVTAFAEDTVIYNEEQLKAAAAQGGTYTVASAIMLTEAIHVTKDLNLNMNQGAGFELNNSPYVTDQHSGFDSMFTVEGANLVLNGQGGNLSYMGYGSAIKLVGAENATTVTVNGPNVSAEPYYDHNISASVFPTSLFGVDNPENRDVQVLLYGGGNMYCRTVSYGYDGALISGENYSTSIKGGNYKKDPSSMVDNGYVAIRNWDGWFVTELSAEYSEAFAAILNDENKLPVKRIKPSLEGEGIWLFAEQLYMDYTYVETNPITFYTDSYDPDEGSMYASRINPENGNIEETHKVIFSFEYNEEIKALVDQIVAQFPQPEGEDEHYFFSVSDLEVINYWLTCSSYYDIAEDCYMEDDNIEDLINYSGEFKKLIDYKNFKLDPRFGDGDFFFTLVGGTAEFKNSGTVYGTVTVGARADHIIYVPETTGDSAEELLAAAQSRIDGYLGVGKVILCEAEPVEGIDGPFFETTINGRYYTLRIEKNDAKMLTPEYLNVDVSTEISVSTKDPSVPLDTMLEVENITGEEQEKLLNTLNVEDGETFDIKLHSGSLNDYVTQTEKDGFQVAIPVPERLKGQTLSAYYVDDNGKVTEYSTNPTESGAVTFATNHFSVYTLAPASKTGTDINGDGKLNVCDLVFLSLVINGEKEDNGKCDLDNNGVIETSDAEVLRKELISTH